MIKMDISTALFVYLFSSVILVLGIWVFHGYKRKEFHLKKDEDYIWRCEICANVYIDSKENSTSKCPVCGSYSSK